MPPNVYPRPTRVHRILAVVAAVLLLAAVRVGQQVYRWYAFAEERQAILALEPVIEEYAVGIVTSQMTARGLEDSIEEIDVDLRRLHDVIDRLEANFGNGSRSTAVEAEYRRSIREYNQRVRTRNELIDSWRIALEQNERQVGRFNATADSVRRLAARMGEDYYPIRSPAEIFAARSARAEGRTDP